MSRRAVKSGKQQIRIGKRRKSDAYQSHRTRQEAAKIAGWPPALAGERDGNSGKRMSHRRRHWQCYISVGLGVASIVLDKIRNSATAADRNLFRRAEAQRAATRKARFR